MSRVSRKIDSIDGIWYDTYEIDDIDEIDIQIFLPRAYLFDPISGTTTQ